jgi:hypothetical protein
MKSAVNIIFCVAAILCMSCTAAYALDTTVTHESGVELKVYNAANLELSSSSDKYDNPAYYSVEYSSNNIVSGQQYVIFMVAADLTGGTPQYTITENSLIYINQKAADTAGSITFDKVYPKSITDSVILISGSGLGDSPVLLGTVDVDGLLGDVNGDSNVNAIDAQQVLKYSASLIEFDDMQKSVADVDGNKNINAIDAQWILRYAAGLVSEFPS